MREALKSESMAYYAKAVHVGFAIEPLLTGQKSEYRHLSIAVEQGSPDSSRDGLLLRRG